MAYQVVRPVKNDSRWVRGRLVIAFKTPGGGGGGGGGGIAPPTTGRIWPRQKT